jgi:hypothetical protein
VPKPPCDDFRIVISNSPGNKRVSSLFPVTTDSGPLSPARKLSRNGVLGNDDQGSGQIVGNPEVTILLVLTSGWPVTRTLFAGSPASVQSTV